MVRIQISTISYLRSIAEAYWPTLCGPENEAKCLAGKAQPCEDFSVVATTEKSWTDYRYLSWKEWSGRGQLRTGGFVLPPLFPVSI